jgi:cytochrome oxidase Cu insertion factor (SCO1/SenC/PrrC family)
MTSIKWVFILLAILFIGPMIAAWSLYSSDNRWLLGETINHGQLIQPPLDFSQFKLTDLSGSPLDSKKIIGQWLMVYITPEPCGAVCEKDLYNLRQVRLALGKDMDRVQRWWVTFPSVTPVILNKTPQKNFPGMHYAKTTLPEVNSFFAKVELRGIAPQQGALYLVDPHGNMMMAYAPGAAPKGLLKDLTRLLNTSQIG